MVSRGKGENKIPSHLYIFKLFLKLFTFESLLFLKDFLVLCFKLQCRTKSMHMCTIM